MTDPAAIPPRRPSAFPLFLAGAAFALGAYLVYERSFQRAPVFDAQPKSITARGDLSEFERTTVALFENCAPAVVHITTEIAMASGTYGGDRHPQGTGSGFVWDESGVIVTNYHVVRGFEDRLAGGTRARLTLRVRLADGKDYEAYFVAGQQEQDIAILRLAAPPSGLRTLPIGSAHDLKVGQSVFAIGNPFGLDQSLTTGIVSALNRAVRADRGPTLSGLIQVDAAINPGNSGGPLLDSAGRLIGMNTAIYSPTGASAGIGFAVPVDRINEVVTALLRDPDGPGVVRGRPILGIEMEPASVPQHFGYTRGVAIRRVLPDSAAATAGLIPAPLTADGTIRGDVIVAIDGDGIDDENDLRSMLGRRRIGDRVTLRVLRFDATTGQHRAMDVPVTLR